MSINLSDYKELLEDLEPESIALLNNIWPDATKIFSPRGLDNYLKGASALQNLGRGRSLVDTWIDEAPQVAKEVGEDVVADLATAALSLASRTSGSVIELVLATAPTAAQRLGDAQLFQNYLQFLNTLIAQAPRGVRPMLDKLDVLFGQLTLGGLRRWAMWGAHAHRTDYEEQFKYFGLQSKESLAILQKERKGTLFVDVQRRINMYMRALWARDFFMKPTSGDFETREGYKPYIENYFIHLPDAYDSYADVEASEIYRAAAAHAAAHLVETREPISAEGLNPLQMAVIAVIEDARIEALSIRRFPGLRKTWSTLHTATPEMATSVGDYLNRLARALLDPAYQDADNWIVEGRHLFAQAQGKLHSHHISWEIGVQLAHRIKDKGLSFNPRTDQLTAPYLDDNRYFWEFVEFDFNKALAAGYDAPKQIRKHVSVMEFANAVEVENAGDDAQEIWVMETEFFPYEDMGISYNELEGKEPVSSPYHYSEWDYQIQLERPAWTTVQEKRAKLGDIHCIDDIAKQYKREIARMKFLLDAMQPQGVRRIRKLEDGDEIDINAAIRSIIDMRMGMQPDPRIMMRSVRKTRDISVLVLLDLSESTNEKVAGQDFSVLDLTRQATVLLADAIDKIGDSFAIHGFCSDGRHDVEYYRYKDFDQPYNEIPKGRLAGMTGQLSTRMGAAMRHASHYLKLQKSAKKLMLVITDGEPADIDVRDPQYLRYDTKKAVEEAARVGIVTYCMSLDPRADQYVSRIFGARNYLVVDHVERLPEKLPILYTGLTR
ncbi:von Willebrand factor type A domain-containing protein [Nitrosomonas cryotolerans]|uniref:von Willebrand factor type A domain-containing protein n=1 Tax=Nitrosomonas cryotolerans ATCC 49181 TaxID=1131553 RepID=A0A1N6IC58_9PROT|nr:nitric oxide reductase activation protein NorD [Nitrosomonas cryotolerans]SFP61148.1 von Willebrand factor type A domain-containing protein [Nitrosomonas cryotolerans]SIO29603.1 von Willebrand factor type A domain-containing protein [Nitrosomonas cryotolerans ATCC 49181]